jgi:predicted glycoside hydrolase/deacetylase ChbG (UPF0249 family)
MRTTRPLTLCADDLGQSRAISEAIIDLAGRRRLNAASLMVDGPEARASAEAVRGLGHFALGLHVALSGGATPFRSELAPAGHLPSADALAVRAFAGRLPRAAIADEIERQFDLFEDLAGRAPAFVDGHQHVHVLPGIRHLFLAAVRRRAPSAWVRSCEEDLAVIRRRGPYRWRAWRSSLLSRGFGAAARDAELRANRGFAGLYDFRSGANYGALFERWLIAPGETPLLICHPARPDRADPIGAARAREHDFLKSRCLDEMLAPAGLHLAD